MDADLGAVEEEAAGMGSVLVVIPTEPGTYREQALQRGGWTVGHYRVVYTIKDAELIVLALRVAYRSAVYRNL